MWPFGWIALLLSGAALIPITDGLGAIVAVVGICGLSVAPRKDPLMPETEDIPLVPTETFYSEFREAVLEDDLGRTIHLRHAIYRIERGSR